MNKERLLNVAKALRESKNPDKFDMNMYNHPCGTPACAFGHYAARTDLQNAFYLMDDGVREYSGRRYDFITHVSNEVLEHFGITLREAEELFDDPFRDRLGGCGGAKTAIEAAEYIEAFVARKETESD